MFSYDSIYRFLKSASVNVISNITIPLSGAISVALLGHLPNISYLAGATLGAILFDFFYESCSFIKSGTTAVTSQAAGRDDREAILLAGLQNTLIALGLGIGFLLLQYPIQKLGFMLLSANSDVEIAGISYFNGRIWGVPIALVNLVLVGWFIGQEKNRQVLLLTVTSNVSNILLNYIFIVLWDWSSMGAGLSQAISQYIALFLGLVMTSREVSLHEISTLIAKVFNFSALKAPFILNRNLSIRSVVIVAIFILFKVFSSILGATVLAENILLLEVVSLSMYMCDGVEYATTTLIANIQAQGTTYKFFPLLQTGLVVNLMINLVVGLAIIFFPNSIFGIFTNHSELIESTKVYIPYVLTILVGSGFTYILDGYFAGLGEGIAIRNTYLVSGSLGLVSLCLSTFYFHSNYFLWLALFIFMLACTVTLSIQIPITLQSNEKNGIFAN